MQKQLVPYINSVLSPYLCGYRKGYNAQSALITLIEKWRCILDKKGYAGAILMDLSKAFDTINYELLIAKLHAYGIQKDSLKLIQSYLTDRWQRTKINATFSSWYELLQGVPQGSVLGPILFNIYLNDLFFSLKDIDICNFADDTTPYVCGQNLEHVLSKLEHNSELAISWFKNNYMKINTDKCHLIIAGHKHEHIWAKLEDNKIWEENEVKLLGIKIDNELKFDNHVTDICLKAGRKLSVLTRMVKYLDFNKRRILFKAFFESQFKYCPLIWMFHSRKTNNKINRLHERALRLIYNDYTTPFDELLDKDNSFLIHHSNIQSLAIELYKVVNNLSEGTFKDIFDQLYNGPNLRSQTDIRYPQVRTELNGKNSIRFYGPQIWNIIPLNIRSICSLEKFKLTIKKWKPINCPCRLCKDYVPNLGFVNLV